MALSTFRRLGKRPGTEVEQILKRDYSDRYLLPKSRPDYTKRDSRTLLLSPQRSLGSVIKMLTPSPGEFTD